MNKKKKKSNWEKSFIATPGESLLPAESPANRVSAQKKKWRPNIELASRRFLSGHPREKHFLIASRAALNRKCIKKNSSARIEIPPVEIHCGWDHTCLRTKKRDLDSKRKKKKKNKVKEEKKSNDTLVRYFVFYSDDVVIYIDSNSERCRDS